MTPDNYEQWFDILIILMVVWLLVAAGFTVRVFSDFKKQREADEIARRNIHHG